MRLHDFSKASKIEPAADNCCTLAPHISDETKCVLTHETETLTIKETLEIVEGNRIQTLLQNNKTSVEGTDLSAEILAPITSDLSNITI